MPFKSKAQQRWMFANDPTMAKRWADHTPNIKALPERVGDSEEKKGFVMNLIPQIGMEAAEAPYVEKLASDSNVTREMVHHLAQRVGLAPIDFVKLAYSNPDEYVLFLKVASQAISPQDAVREFHRVKTANPGVLSRLMQFARSTPGKLTLGGAGLATAGGGAYLATRGGGGAQPAAPSGPTSQALEQVNAAQQAAAAPNPAVQGAAQGAASPEAPAGGAGGGGMGKALPILAALGVGGLGAGVMMGRRKKKEKQAFDQSMAIRAMRRAIEKKAEEIQKNQARKILNTHLDKVASFMSLEKQAQVRTLQAELSKGKNLSQAIKVAYPTLKGEQRGILATQLVRAAIRDQFKQAESCSSSVPTTEPRSMSVPISQAGKKLRAMSKEAVAPTPANAALGIPPTGKPAAVPPQAVKPQ